jgi:mevalonate kinase
MAGIYGKAPGKIILFGEHAVVYGQPAIAIPVTKVKATAHIYPDIQNTPGTISIQALDIGLEATLNDLPEDHPIAKAIKLTLQKCSLNSLPAFTLQVSSSIPISAGMGSGAAISVAIIRGVSAFLGKRLSSAEISDLAYEVEKIHHGNPSGIDNNVITYQKPVYYIRNAPIEFLDIKEPTYWVIADTGEKTPTLETVSAVRNLYEKDPEIYGAIIQTIGQISQEACTALVKGDISLLGYLMNENQKHLSQLEVSSPKLEKLIEISLSSGAAGAKLSGGGRGGQIIAITEEDQLEHLKESLLREGAIRVITTTLTKSGPQ